MRVNLVYIKKQGPARKFPGRALIHAITKFAKYTVTSFTSPFYLKQLPQVEYPCPINSSTELFEVE